MKQSLIKTLGSLSAGLVLGALLVSPGAGAPSAAQVAQPEGGHVTFGNPVTTINHNPRIINGELVGPYLRSSILGKFCANDTTKDGYCVDMAQFEQTFKELKAKGNS